MMIRRPFAALTAVLLVVGLAACGSASSASAGADAPHSNPTAAQPKRIPKGVRNQRQNIVKHIGEEAGVLSGDQTLMPAKWTVTNIVIDPPCTGQFSQPPAAGHYVELDISVETTADYKDTEYGSLALGAPAAWFYIQKDGTQWNGQPSGNAYNCIARDQMLPDMIGTSMKASGKVLFDLPSTDGTLVFTQNGTASGGWEYPLSSDGKA